jgi:hypothetical protein
MGTEGRRTVLLRGAQNFHTGVKWIIVKKNALSEDKVCSWKGPSLYFPIAPPKRRYSPTVLHDVTSQETETDTHAQTHTHTQHDDHMSPLFFLKEGIFTNNYLR